MTYFKIQIQSRGDRWSDEPGAEAHSIEQARTEADRVRESYDGSLDVRIVRVTQEVVE